jgi:hypothetical protein
MSTIKKLFSSEEVVRKGLFSDMMYMRTTSKEIARDLPDIEANIASTQAEVDVKQEIVTFCFITHLTNFYGNYCNC